MPASMLDAFHSQIDWCQRLGSPFTAAVLTVLATDLQAGGPVAKLVSDWPGDAMADALPLRLAGALNSLVLAGAAPYLAALYPPQHTDCTPATLTSPLQRALTDHAGTVTEFLRLPPQTNEVGRSAVLLGGFLEIARRTGLPLRLLEIGASAGLNLMWDRYQYRIGSQSWGDPTSPVVLVPDWRSEQIPALQTPITVATRAGCDLRPTDLSDPEQRRRLLAYVWPDQQQRVRTLNTAIAVAMQHPVKIDTADAAEWTERQLSTLPSGQVTVLCHSIVWTYLPSDTRARIKAALVTAAQQAAATAPLAWLRFELGQDNQPPELCLTLWPDGQERQLATAHPHGAWVDWRASDEND